MFNFQSSYNSKIKKNWFQYLFCNFLLNKLNCLNNRMYYLNLKERLLFWIKKRVNENLKKWKKQKRRKGNARQKVVVVKSRERLMQLARNLNGPLCGTLKSMMNQSHVKRGPTTSLRKTKTGIWNLSLEKTASHTAGVIKWTIFKWLLA